MDSSVLTQRIYRSLLDEIVSGKLKPGEPLSRRRIAERHGCSYTPVIEALIRLEYAGLVESESFRTPRVCGCMLPSRLTRPLIKAQWQSASVVAVW